MIKEAVDILLQRKDLTASQMESVMEEIMTGKAGTDCIVAFLTALNKKGETVGELSAAVLVMRRHVTKISIESNVVLDTCGTGGDKKGTFNVSTAAAFVASGCGITVAKHGNRSVSSRCGSADILEAAGIDINMGRDRLERCLNCIGIAFLFAPNLHPAMKYAMPARMQIRDRTIFNILGPLTNPAGATHQLLGVYDRYWTDILAEVLSNLGTAHALVVCSADGLDEVSTSAETFVCEESSGKLNSYQLRPEDFGFRRARLEDLKGGAVSDNVKIMFDVLEGKPGPYRDMVVLNAGAAIYAADRAGSIKEGIELARASIDSGEAMKKLKLLKEYSLRK